MSRLRFPGKTYGDWKIVFPPQTTRHFSWWIVCRQEDILIANWTRKSFYGISQNRLHKTFNKIYPRRCNFRLLLPSTWHPRRSILFYNAFIKSKNVPFNWSFAPKENHAKKEDSFEYNTFSSFERPNPPGAPVLTKYIEVGTMRVEFRQVPTQFRLLSTCHLSPFNSAREQSLMMQ